MSTGGFTGFVPFAFEPQTTVLSHVKGRFRIRTASQSRCQSHHLDNINHLTAYWVSLGLPLAQVSLSYGVDDLHGTILEEKIFHMAGATAPQQQTVAPRTRRSQSSAATRPSATAAIRQIFPRPAGARHRPQAPGGALPHLNVPGREIHHDSDNLRAGHKSDGPAERALPRSQRMSLPALLVGLRQISQRPSVDLRLAGICYA